jgi:Uma2 family endonuclease
MTPVVKDISQLNLNGTYSYADYLTWQFEQAVELIKGRVFEMSPAPKTYHQRISRRITRYFENYLFGKQCEFFVAPFDVRLIDKQKSRELNKDIFTVVQPDLCVICNSEKIDEDGCMGAPDLIVEILSKGNSKKEMRLKYELYEECGVREYWIADPEHQTLHQFVLDDNEKYRLIKIHTTDEIASTYLFPELKVDISEIFAE